MNEDPVSTDKLTSSQKSAASAKSEKSQTVIINETTE